MNKKIIKSLCSWSILEMAKSFNYKLVQDEQRFTKWLEAMPIFMTDYTTSNQGDFNKLANEYIMAYNKNL